MTKIAAWAAWAVTPGAAVASTIAVAIARRATPVARRSFGSRPRRNDRLGQRLHAGRDDDYLPDWPLPDALAAHFGLVPQGQMQNAPLAAVHRAEVKRDTRFLDALGRRQRAHAQLLDAQDAVI